MVSYIMMVNQNRWMLCLCFVKFLLECVVKSFSHFLSKCIFSRHFIRHQYFCAWLRLILIWINILILYLSINVKGNWILRRELVYDILLSYYFSLNVKHILLSFDKRKLHPLLSFSVAKTLPDVIKSKFKSRWPTRTNCDEHKEALVVYWLVSI